MDTPPAAADEESRLSGLHQYSLAHAARSPALHEIAELAAALCQTPIAFIAFVDETHQRIVSAVGLEPCEALREGSFGNCVIARSEPLIVGDARAESRLASDPLVTNSAAVFYAGTPLLAPGRRAIGCLAVADRAPGSLTETQIQGLTAL